MRIPPYGLWGKRESSAVNLISSPAVCCVRENLQDIKNWKNSSLFPSRLSNLIVFFSFTLTRVPDRAARVRHRVLQLGGVWGGAAPPPGGRGRLRGDVLPSAGGPEWEHEPGLPARSQRVRPLHRVHEGESWWVFDVLSQPVLCCVSDVERDTPVKKKKTERQTCLLEMRKKSITYF